MKQVSRLLSGTTAMGYTPYIAYSCAFIIRPRYLSIVNKRGVHYHPNKAKMVDMSNYKLNQRYMNNKAPQNDSNEKSFIDHYQTLKLTPVATELDVHLSFISSYFFHQIYTWDNSYSNWLSKDEQTEAFNFLKELRAAKTTLLDAEKRKKYDTARASYYRDIGRAEYIQKPPEQESVLDRVYNRNSVIWYFVDPAMVIFIGFVYGSYLIADSMLAFIPGYDYYVHGYTKEFQENSTITSISLEC